MKRMRIWSLVLLCTGLWQGISAQDGNVLITDLIDPSGLNTELLYSKRYADFEGSPFVFDDWKTAVIQSQTGNTFEPVLLKIDAYSDELLMKKEKEEVLVNKSAVASVTIMEDERPVHVFKQLPVGNMGKHELVEILFEGNHAVYKQYDVVMTRIENNAGGYGGGGSSAERKKLTMNEIYYLKRGEEFVQFKPNKKGILGVLSDKEGDVASFIKKNKVKVNSDASLKQIMAYYDTL